MKDSVRHSRAVACCAAALALSDENTALLILDRDGEIEVASEAFLHLYGLSGATLSALPKPPLPLIHVSQHAQFLSLFAKSSDLIDDSEVVVLSSGNLRRHAEFQCHHQSTHTHFRSEIFVSCPSPDLLLFHWKPVASASTTTGGVQKSDEHDPTLLLPSFLDKVSAPLENPFHLSSSLLLSPTPLLSPASTSSSPPFPYSTTQPSTPAIEIPNSLASLSEPSLHTFPSYSRSSRIVPPQSPTTKWDRGACGCSFCVPNTEETVPFGIDNYSQIVAQLQHHQALMAKNGHRLVDSSFHLQSVVEEVVARRSSPIHLRYDASLPHYVLGSPAFVAELLDIFLDDLPAHGKLYVRASPSSSPPPSSSLLSKYININFIVLRSLEQPISHSPITQLRHVMAANIASQQGGVYKWRSLPPSTSSSSADSPTTLQCSLSLQFLNANRQASQVDPPFRQRRPPHHPTGEVLHFLCYTQSSDVARRLRSVGEELKLSLRVICAISDFERIASDSSLDFQGIVVDPEDLKACTKLLDVIQRSPCWYLPILFYARLPIDDDAIRSMSFTGKLLHPLQAEQMKKAIECIFLPVELPAPQRKRYRYHDRALEDSVLDDIEVDEGETKPRRRPAPKTRFRVLIVEDNTVNQAIVQNILRSISIESDTVDNGVDVVTRYKEAPYRFDLILMDSLLPQLDGFQATETIRQFEVENQIAPIPIIAVTGVGGGSDPLPHACDHALAAGMNDFISKPIDVNAFCSKVKKWLSHSSNSRAQPDNEPLVFGRPVSFVASNLKSFQGELAASADMNDGLRIIEQINKRRLPVSEDSLVLFKDVPVNRLVLVPEAPGLVDGILRRITTFPRWIDSLQHLDLTSAFLLQDNGLVALSSLKVLRTLRISRSLHISTAALEQLRAAIPALIISAE